MFYHRLGKIPPKRHTQFRQPDGSLYHEELVSSEGFSGIYSNLYHINPPTRIKTLKEPTRYGPGKIQDYALRHTHLNTSGVTTTGLVADKSRLEFTTALTPGEMEGDWSVRDPSLAATAIAALLVPFSGRGEKSSALASRGNGKRFSLSGGRGPG